MSPPLQFHRRRFLQLLAGGAFAVGALPAYMHWVSARWLEVSHQTVPLGRTPHAKPLRVLHLSDLHASSVVPLPFIAHAISLGLATQPDLIVLTGDFITNRYDDFTHYAQVLKRLPAAAPTFACPGNHDGGSWTRRAGGYPRLDEVEALLRAAGITMLQNSSHDLSVAGRNVQLIGVGDLWSDRCDPAAAFARTSSRGDGLRLLLNHNPDAKDLMVPFDWDLMLCGHTHGGQLVLPLLGAPFAPVADKRYLRGLHRWSDRWMFITRSVGNLHGLRFNCRPEVSVLELA